MQSAVALHENSKGETYALRAKCSTSLWFIPPLLNTRKRICQYKDGIDVRETGAAVTGAPLSTFTTDTTPMMCLQKQFQGESCA